MLSQPENLLDQPVEIAWDSECSSEIAWVDMWVTALEKMLDLERGTLWGPEWVRQHPSGNPPGGAAVPGEAGLVARC